jgi:glycosyltransferase involved in cell wall biosynthesis
MKKVLVFGPPPFGGISSVMKTILDSPLAKDYSFEVFERSNIPQECSGYLSRNIFRMKRFIQFVRNLRQRPYDFVHIHTPFSAGFPGTIIFMIIARFTGTKILLHIHGTDWDSCYVERSEFTKFVFRIGFRIPQMIIVLYETWRINIKKLVPTAKVHTIANCLEDVIPPDPDQVKKIRPELGMSNENLFVLTVGFVGPRKGYLDILDAVPQVVQSDESVRFVFVGGEERPGENYPVLSKIKNQNLDRWVIVTGEIDRSKIPSLLASTDVFLLPSREEGMPIAILEAMRAGLPIITTTVGGIPEMIEDGVSGILIEPENPEKIAEALLTLMNNKVLREDLASGARAVFETKFETRVCISELETIYESM